VDSGTHSRGGWEFSTGDGGNLQADFWDSPVSGEVWFYFLWQGVSQANTANTEYEVMYFHHQTAAATGKVRLIWVYATATTGKFRLEYNDGSSWTVIGAIGSARALTTEWYCRVAIDITATTGRSAALVVNNTADISGSTGTTDLIAGTPAPLAGQLKGSGAITWDLWEIFGNDTNATGGHSAVKAYTNATSGFHCFGNYPIKDVPGFVEWTTRNSGVHGRFRFGALDDPEDDHDHTDDYILSTGSAQDYLAEISDQTHASATIAGVSIYVENRVGLGFIPTHILVSVPSEDSGVPTAYTGTTTGPINDGRYLFLAQTPGSADWSKALYNEMRVGVRGDANDRCYMICVSAVGTNLERPTAAVELPPPGNVVLGNPMII
ncbi:hypothetical protein LCGC14_2816680, partial [marine sediment metagenome]